MPGPDALSSSPTRTRPRPRTTLYARLKPALAAIALHARKHAGVGVVCAVAYFDPGNWAVDLQAGSQYGFQLLFTVLVAGIFAAFLQALATRLGCVTGLDLASHCRVLFYDRPKHPLLYRRLVLYPLYALSEIAIIATDLAELLGSAIGLCLLFPRLELWHAVIITAVDVVFLLALRDPLSSKPVKMFEILIAVLVLAVLVCMVIIISKVHVDWDDAFKGYLPSKDLFGANGLYTSVGILGATIMPHSLFLGSSLATQQRVDVQGPPGESAKSDTKQDSESDSHKMTWKSFRDSLKFSRLREFFVSLFRRPPPSAYSTSVKRHADRENNSLAFVRSHLNHAIFDVIGSLLGFAVLINSMILIIASMVFYYGHDSMLMNKSASLFDAYNVIHRIIGRPAATLFAVALLASGQSSSIIATVAGQAVAEGFLHWRVSPIIRRLLTRLIAVVPSMAVAIALGRRGIDALLVASQVILAIVLPFIILPLVFLTSSKTVMRVRKSEATGTESEGPWEDSVDYSSGKVATLIGATIWLTITTANLYVTVTLIMGVSH